MFYNIGPSYILLKCAKIVHLGVNYAGVSALYNIVPPVTASTCPIVTTIKNANKVENTSAKSYQS